MLFLAEPLCRVLRGGKAGDRSSGVMELPAYMKRLKAWDDAEVLPDAKPAAAGENAELMLLFKQERGKYQTVYKTSKSNCEGGSCPKLTGKTDLNEAQSAHRPERSSAKISENTSRGKQ